MTPLTQEQMQQLACGALRIERRIGHPCQMAALIYVFGLIANVTNCDQIAAGAQTMACIPRQSQLPALIWLATQILSALPGQSVFMGNYGGNPPPFSPIIVQATIAGAGQTTAIAYDTSTGQQWSYFNRNWQ